jgi:hypothetical protein
MLRDMDSGGTVPRQIRGQRRCTCTTQHRGFHRCAQLVCNGARSADDFVRDLAERTISLFRNGQDVAQITLASS